MKTHLIKSIAAGFMLVALGTSPALAATDCAPVYKSVHAAVTKDPSTTLKAVTDALAANEECACQIVQAAIKASKADSEGVGQIVEAAILASSAMANTIVECATAVAPDALEEIEAAYRRAMSDAAGGGYTLSPTALGGVYLVTPTAPATGDQAAQVITVIVPTRDRPRGPGPSPGAPAAGGAGAGGAGAGGADE